MNEIGRTEKCPCGSGRKYKKCCGSEEQSHLKDLPLGIRMKGGVKFDPAANGFVVIVHTWDNVQCKGEPEEWSLQQLFPTEEEALDYYKTSIRPSLKRLMAKFENALPSKSVHKVKNRNTTHR